jgi:hypothetical protein
MTEETENTVSEVVYDSPIILPGEVAIEPQRYVVERPYDLTRYEYSYLKRNFSGGFWCNIFAGATAGLVISVLGKSVISLIANKTPNLQTWELVSIGMGVLLSLLFKFCIKSDDDKKTGINRSC